nr:chromosome partition protein like [Tanacetum cinerariifolium]
MLSYGGGPRKVEDGEAKNIFLTKVKRGTSSQFFATRAAERESEFEIDREKAREALRKLDQQLDVMSQKQTNNVPKTKAANPYNVTDEAIKDVQDTGSFLPLAFFALLVFTVVYNIVFIKVIKPSVDGPQVELAPVRSSIMKEILKAELLPSIQLTPSPETR